MITVITGPTASGKTHWALKLASKWETDIINCDSRQVYRYMDIGTAKPTPGQLQLVKHHLIDVVDPDEDYNAACFMTQARDIAQKVLEQKDHVLLVGGTGFYLSAFLNGISDLPPLTGEVKSKVQNYLRAHALDDVYARLQGLDPGYAERFTSRDIYRMRRFLEIYWSTGQVPSKYFAEHAPCPISLPYRIFYLNIPRDALYNNIDLRVETMIKSGLIQEVEALYNKGYDENLRAMQTIGYLEILQVLKGRLDVFAAKEQIRRRTRRFAKRQIIWFRRMADMVHIEDPARLLAVS